MEAHLEGEWEANNGKDVSERKENACFLSGPEKRLNIIWYSEVGSIRVYMAKKKKKNLLVGITSDEEGAV